MSEDSDLYGIQTQEGQNFFSSSAMAKFRIMFCPHWHLSLRRYRNFYEKWRSKKNLNVASKMKKWGAKVQIGTKTGEVLTNNVDTS